MWNNRQYNNYEKKEVPTRINPVITYKKEEVITEALDETMPDLDLTIEPMPIESEPRPDPFCDCGKENFGRVRFLHLSAGSPAVNISYRNTDIAKNLEYLQASEYVPIEDGFRTFTISTTSTPSSIVHRQTLTIKAGDKVTVCIINTKRGITLRQVRDIPCNNKPADLSCVRVAHMAYNCPPVDLMLEDGRMVFSDVQFKEVTSFRTARPGNYPFVVVETKDNNTLNPNPPTAMSNFDIDMMANMLYTIYLTGIVGSTTTPITAVVLESME